jgi:hypothetical protein
MDFDWFNNFVYENLEPFNNYIIKTELIISNIHNPNENTTKQIINNNILNDIQKITSNNLIGNIKIIENISECFNLESIQTKKDMILLCEYVVNVSNYLKNIIRDANITIEQYNLNLKYLDWILQKCILLNNLIVNKNYLKHDKITKLFKTSSYNFCSQKEKCPIHGKKYYKCNKHHFIFDLLIYDIKNLINSLNAIKYDNFIQIINNKYYDVENNCIIDNNDDNIYISKNTIFKCFDVVNYVVGKILLEYLYFVNNNIKSQYILYDNFI